MDAELIRVLENSITEYERKKELDCVVNPSFPIPYFGNSKAYYKSDIKIVSVGLNPSKKEIGFKRFKAEDTSKIDAVILKNSLDDYFVINPYTSWFNPSFEWLLQALGSSYYGAAYLNQHKVPSWYKPQPNVALHTDILSPIVTDPTWNKLSESEKCELSSSGVLIWQSLIKALAPDLIIISTARKNLNYINVESWGIRPIQYPDGKVYEILFGKMGKSLVVWGAAGVKPFQVLRKSHKSEFSENVKQLLLSHLQHPSR